MAGQGGLTLNDLPLEDLLSFLDRTRATGTLSAKTRHHRKKVVLLDGRVAGVSSTNPCELLGHFLVGWGSVTEEQVALAAALQDTLGTPLGRILERMGAVDGQTLESALRAQAEEAILELFLVATLERRFLDGVVPTERPLDLDLGIQPIVLEGLRRRVAVQELELALGGLDVIPARTDIEPPPALAPRDVHILGEINGSRDLDAIALAAHVVPFHVAEFIARALADGLVTLTPSPAPGSLPSADEIIAVAEDALASGDLRTGWRAVRRLHRLSFDEDRRLRLRAIERGIEEAFAHRRPPTKLIPHLRHDLSGAVADLDTEEAFVLSRVNGSWTLRDIQRITPITELHFALIIDTLVGLGLVELRHPGAGL